MKKTQEVKGKANPKGNIIIQAKEEKYNNFVKREALTRRFSWLEPYPDTPKSWAGSLVQGNTRETQPMNG